MTQKLEGEPLVEWPAPQEPRSFERPYCHVKLRLLGMLTRLLAAISAKTASRHEHAHIAVMTVAFQGTIPDMSGLPWLISIDVVRSLRQRSVTLGAAGEQAVWHSTPHHTASAANPVNPGQFKGA